jgi:hypothetical protein
VKGAYERGSSHSPYFRHWPLEEYKGRNHCFIEQIFDDNAKMHKGYIPGNPLNCSLANMDKGCVCNWKRFEFTPSFELYKEHFTQNLPTHDLELALLRDNYGSYMYDQTNHEMKHLSFYGSDEYFCNFGSPAAYRKHYAPQDTDQGRVLLSPSKHDATNKPMCVTSNLETPAPVQADSSHHYFYRPESQLSLLPSSLESFFIYQNEKS